ncbi:hypothetical protein TSOC_000837 [Tetrabaena socialis]|uniref:Uncharacterized protein n=1 Tax=Tetrabaena socialis TaxID=47790 RepID=A0A2J8AI78_9CHLO|nr:hypothetical protein TSOC_000837 [Tetrabaena socialis]|eukprot:PNH12222.1 hypothetical protein TSOC_000837 [Tetrabaena socialis]
MERPCRQAGTRPGQRSSKWPALSCRSLVTVASSQPAGAGAAAGPKKAWAPPNALLKINPALLPGGLDVSKEGPQAKASLDGHLSSLFLPVNLEHPGLRVLNIDPPVITVDDFLSAAECDDIVAGLSPGDWVVPLQPAQGTWRSGGLFAAADWHRVPDDIGLAAAATMVIKWGGAARGVWHVQSAVHKRAEVKVGY